MLKDDFGLFLRNEKLVREKMKEVENSERKFEKTETQKLKEKPITMRILEVEQKKSLWNYEQ